MTSAIWFFPSMISLCGWGVSVFMPKLALKSMPPLHLLIYQTVFFALGVIVLQVFYGFHIGFNAQGVLLAVVTGVCGTAGQWLYMAALQHGSLTRVSMISSLYPLVVTLMSFFILHEHITLRQGAGIALGISAIILLVTAHDE